MSETNETKNLAKIRDLIENASGALALAKQMLADLTGVPTSASMDTRAYADKAASIGGSTTGGRVIEGVFDGQNMIDKKGTVFPVPANYASKSKLIPGDVLKLTVTEEGKFLYKQIGPVERKTIIGPLVYNDGRYHVLANGKAYNVLLASVTYFRAKVGDEVTLIIPLDETAEWGAIEAVLPNFDGEDVVTEKKPAKSSKSKKEIDLESELDI